MHIVVERCEYEVRCLIESELLHVVYRVQATIVLASTGPCTLTVKEINPRKLYNIYIYINVSSLLLSIDELMTPAQLHTSSLVLTCPSAIHVQH